jgi:hypothetical protein
MHCREEVPPVEGTLPSHGTAPSVKSCCGFPLLTAVTARAIRQVPSRALYFLPIISMGYDPQPTTVEDLSSLFDFVRKLGDEIKLKEAKNHPLLPITKEAVAYWIGVMDALKEEQS